MTHSQTPETHSVQPRRKRWVRILLFVSLALNMVIFGIIGGAMLGQRRGEDHPSRMSKELGLGPYLYALESKGRRDVQKSARQNSDPLRSGRQAWRQAFSDSLVALRADPFDAETFRQAIVRQADVAAEGRKVGQDILVQQVSGMSAAERSAFADRLQKGIRDKRDRGATRNDRKP